MDPETGGRCIRSLRMVRVAAGNGLKLHFFLGAVFKSYFVQHYGN